MRGITPSPAPSHLNTTPQDLLARLAHAYAAHFAGDAAPSGPWADFLDCFCGALAKLMAHAFQKVSRKIEWVAGDAALMGM